MSLFLEKPNLDKSFPFRIFINSGKILVYPHWHKEVEFIYVLEGLVNIGVEEKVVKLKKGEIYFFDSGVSHYFLASPESERIVLQFDLKIFQESSYALSQDQKVRNVFRSCQNHSVFWPQKAEKDVGELIKKMHKEVEKELEGTQYSIKGILFEMLVNLMRNVPKKEKDYLKRSEFEASRNQEALDFLDQIFSYIEKRSQDLITLEDIANHIGFSPYYFTRFFKRHTGLTFMQFLTEYRINNAKYILANENIPMTEVAEKSGFQSVKTFHHVFKQQVGLSPLRYQKEVLIKT